MTTKIQNISQSPSYRQSEPPLDSIIRQVATPSAYQERQNPILLSVPASQRLTSFHASQPASLHAQQPASFHAASMQVPQTVLLAPQLHSQSSRMLETAQFVGAPAVQQSRAVHPVPSELPPVPAVRRVEYVPYEQRYIEYVEQRIKVPVQRVCTDYYQVEHIVDYMPVEKEEVVYEVQPQEVVTMRLQYVPVEQKIIHISDKNAQALGIKDYISTDAHSTEIIAKSPLYEAVTVNGPAVALEKSRASTVRKSRTNFVTSEGYDPQANLQQIDNLLSASSVRGSRAKQ